VAVDPVLALSLDEPLLDVEQARRAAQRPTVVGARRHSSRAPAVHSRWASPALHPSDARAVGRAAPHCERRNGRAICSSRERVAMSDKPTVTNREELDQAVDRRVVLGSLLLEDDPPRSSWQHPEPPDDAESRCDDVDEWFARAALGQTCEDAAPSRELLGAATLPLHGARARTTRPRRALMGASGLARLWGPRGRALLLGTFGALAVVVVVVIVMRSVTSRPSTSATPPVVVTDEGASTDKVGDPVDRGLKITTGREAPRCSTPCGCRGSPPSRQ
jgi:hypothetical protein